MIETGSYDFPVVACGVMPPNALCIGLVANGAESTRYNTTSRVLASGGLSLPSQMSYQEHYPGGVKSSACLLACCRDKANTPGLAEWTFVGRK